MSRFSLVLALLLFTGCVTQGTYDALLMDRDSLKKDRDAVANENKSLKQATEDLGKKLANALKSKDILEDEKSAMLNDSARLQTSIEETKAALAELSRRKAEADARLAEFKNLLDRFRSLIDAGKLQVKIVDGRMVVALASDVLFASGSAKLSNEGKASISEVATVLASIPDRGFQVEGHTDNVPIKSAQYPSNWELAASRAITVVKTMVEAGMPAERISGATYGEHKPAKSNETADGKAANRRIEIVVVPDLSSLPGFDELNRVSGT